MRLLHVVTLDEIGGLENQVLKFLRWLPEDVDNTILLPQGNLHPAYARQLKQTCRVIRWKYAAGWKLPRYPQFIRPWFFRHRIDAEHFDLLISYSQLSPRNLFDSFESRALQTSVFYDHGASWYKSPAKYRDLLCQYDEYHAVSRASRIILQKRFHLEDQGIKVVPNTLTEAEFESYRSAADQARAGDESLAFSSDEAFRLLFVGRINPHKGINVLIRALDHLPSKVELLLVGGGSEWKALEKLAEDLGVAQRIHVFGERENLLSFYRAADLLVLPSVRESFGMVLLEAGAAELPVVASNIDGIPDIIRSRKEGVLLDPSEPVDRYEDDWSDADFPECVVDGHSQDLIPPRFLDPVKLAEAIEELRQSPDRRNQLGVNLQRRVREEFVGNSGFKGFDRILS